MVSVLVVGGGIAGCAVALAARRAGADVAVREAHPVPDRDEGAFLTLAQGGVRALDQLGALAAVDEVGGHLVGFRAQEPDATVVLERPLGEDGPAYRYLLRADLCAVLRRRVVAGGIDLRHGARVLGARASGGGVEAVFDDGRRERADLLVAADGLRSTLRALVDPDGPPPRHVGQHVFYGRAATVEHGRPHAFHTVRGRVAFGYIPTGRETLFFARVAGSAPDPGRPPDPRASLLEVLDGISAEIVRAADQVLVVDAHDLPRVGAWSRDGMLLVGDAAHAASPATGQGASTALEDGVVLGKALRQFRRIDEALAAYERHRRDRVQANIMASARQSAPDGPVPDAPEGRALSAAELADQLDWARPLLG